MNRKVFVLALFIGVASGIAYVLLAASGDRPTIVAHDEIEVDSRGVIVDDETPRPASLATSQPESAPLPVDTRIEEADPTQAAMRPLPGQQSGGGGGRSGGGSKSRVIVVEGVVQTKPPRGTPAPPPAPMPGARDETWYVRHLPPGSKVEVPTETSDAGKALRMVYGILASPATLESRVIPLLDTALREETAYVFIERNDTIPQFAAAMAHGRKAIKERQLHNATMVHLDTIPDMKMSQRNSWMDLPVIRWMAERHRFNATDSDVDWFAIVDDDTYPITAAVREVLAQYSPTKQPLVVGDMLRWGEGGGFRLVRMRDGQRKFIPSTKRQPITFPCGGGGIFLNIAAVRRLYRHLNPCIEKHFHPAGDLRLGACLVDARVPLVRRREFVKDVHFRAIGDLQLYQQFAFPASFHRMRSASWYHELRHVEQQAGRWGIVHWDTIRREFPPGEKDHYHSLYHPSDYENCTAIFGVRPTPKPYNPKIKWGKKGLPPLPPSRGNPQADEWGGCKITPTTRAPTRGAK